MIQRLIGEDIEIEVQLTSDLWPIRGARAELEQVLLNLVVNARDAMERGGTLTIETANVELGEAQARSCKGAGASGPHAMVSVTDTGVGIPDDAKDKIFEPFFTTKAEGKGTGLGLATVYGIVIQHQGSIAVFSEYGKGTRIEVYFPRFLAGIEEEKADVLFPAPTGSETILVVEDEAIVRDVVVGTLKKQGYRVLSAAHPRDGLTLARDHPGPIHLLLTDVVMPEMDGTELRRRVQEIRTETRFLYMSGYTRGAMLAMESSGEEVLLLHKPFKSADLARYVRLAMEGGSGG
jgi:CheY-like chemotaxis protein